MAYGSKTVSYTKDGVGKSKTIQYFDAETSKISVPGFGGTGITAATAKGRGIYGVNGTFFQNSESYNPPRAVYGVAISNGAIPFINRDTQGGITYGGDRNHSDLDSFMLGTYNPIEGAYVFLSRSNQFPFNAYVKNVYPADCRWAIGGHNLNLVNNFSNQGAFESALSKGAKDPGYRYQNVDTARTFIGYNATTSKVWLCTCFGGCDFYDEHLILKALGCSYGMNLDGGGSTQISHGTGSSGSRAVPTWIQVG